MNLPFKHCDLYNTIITSETQDRKEIEKAAEPDAMTQYIEDLFNITLEPLAVTWSNYKERYQILSATGSLPDVFATLTLSSNDNNDSCFLTKNLTGIIRIDTAVFCKILYGNRRNLCQLSDQSAD